MAYNPPGIGLSILPLVFLDLGTGCSVEKYFLCVLPGPSNATSMESRCDCPAACNVTTYNADLSYAALSLDGIDALLSDDHDEIQRKHVAAKELQDRVESSSMIEIFEKLYRIETSVAQFDQFIKSKIERIETSLIYRLQTAIFESIQMAHNDVENLFKNISKYSSFYRNNLAFERDWLVETVEHAHYMLKGATLPIMWNWLDSSLTAECLPTVTDRLVQTRDLLSAIGERTYRYEYKGGLHHFFLALEILLDEVDYKCYFPNYAMYLKKDDPYCGADNAISINNNETKDFVQKLLNKLSYLSQGQNFMEIIAEEQYFFHDILSMHYRNLEENQKNLSSCINEYRDYLATTQQWLQNSHLSFNSTMKQPPPLNLDSFNWGSMYELYQQNQMTSEQMAQHVQSVYENVWKKEVVPLTAYLKEELGFVLVQDIIKLNKEMNDYYILALQKFIRLLVYFDDQGERQAGLTEAFQHMKLWRIPHLEVETQTLPVYELTVNESAAAKAAAGDVTSQIEAIVPTIQAYVNSYFGEVRNVFAAFLTSEEKLVREQEEAFEDVLSHLNSLAQNTDMDGDFVRSNFLKLDVYYSEVKYEMVQQTASYGPLEFFSELGGYLGLCLGASIVTVCELMDMIIFQIILSRYQKDDDNHSNNNGNGKKQAAKDENRSNVVVCYDDKVYDEAEEIYVVPPTTAAAETVHLRTFSRNSVEAWTPETTHNFPKFTIKKWLSPDNAVHPLPRSHSLPENLDADPECP